MIEAVSEAHRDGDHFGFQRGHPGWMRGVAAAMVSQLQQTVGEAAGIIQVQQVAPLDGQAKGQSKAPARRCHRLDRESMVKAYLTCPNLDRGPIRRESERHESRQGSAGRR